MRENSELFNVSVFTFKKRNRMILSKQTPIPSTLEKALGMPACYSKELGVLILQLYSCVRL